MSTATGAGTTASPIRPAWTAAGVLESATISFGQALDPDVLDPAAQPAADCDVLLAVGTSLAVHPAAGSAGR
jgi:NAD-dependent deacetylase